MSLKLLWPLPIAGLCSVLCPESLLVLPRQSPSLPLLQLGLDGMSPCAVSLEKPGYPPVLNISKIYMLWKCRDQAAGPALCICGKLLLIYLSILLYPTAVGLITHVLPMKLLYFNSWCNNLVFLSGTMLGWGVFSDFSGMCRWQKPLKSDCLNVKGF